MVSFLFISFQSKDRVLREERLPENTGFHWLLCRFIQLALFHYHTDLLEEYDA